MTTIYLNWKGPQGRETVDEFTPEPGQTGKAFRAYVSEMRSEYAMAGMSVYQSSRPCANWKGSPMATDNSRSAILWLLNDTTARVELAAFNCETDSDETAAAYIACVTGLKVTVQRMTQTTAEPEKG